MRVDGKTDGTADLAGLKVLVVEDEAVVAFDLEFSLRDFGCDVLPSAASVADAMATLSSGPPNIVLLDVRLSDGPATPVAAALKALGVPYIVTTGYDHEQIAEPLLREAPQLAKPYQLAELRNLLLGVVRGTER